MLKYSPTTDDGRSRLGYFYISISDYKNRYIAREIENRDNMLPKKHIVSKKQKPTFILEKHRIFVLIKCSIQNKIS